MKTLGVGLIACGCAGVLWCGQTRAECMCKIFAGTTGGAELVICVDNFVHDRCIADDDARLRQQRCMIYVEAPC